MKVWLVIHANKDLIAVFDSEEKADDFIGQSGSGSVWLYVEEWEVQ